MATHLDLRAGHRETNRELRPPLWRRLGWFAFIWVLSVLAIGAVAFLIRTILI